MGLVRAGKATGRGRPYLKNLPASSTDTVEVTE